jgi:RNA polymerase-associated protein LEO1
MPGSSDQLFGSGSDDDDWHESKPANVDDEAELEDKEPLDEFLQDEDAEDGIPENSKAAEIVQDIEVHLVPTRPAESLYLLKRSTALDLETKPFRSEHYQPNAEEFVDSKGVTRYKAHDTNCIRWRQQVAEDGTSQPQSNSRFVRWSDGSLQLLVGDEVFDVVTQDISKDTMYLYNNRTMWQASATHQACISLPVGWC